MNPYIKLPNVQIVNGRHELILKKCKNKCVLHLGCVDSGLLHEKFEREELMHQKLSDVANEIWGVDIDEPGISYLSNKGFNNLIVADISKLDEIKIIQNISFDIVVASEVIEHLQNPGLFLNSVKDLMIPEKTELIVTVPNAFRIDTLLWLLRGIEYVHPDHNYWFSYHTATNLLRKNNYKINEVYVYNLVPIEIVPGRIRQILYKKRKKMNNLQAENEHTTLISFVKLISSYCKSFPKRLLGSLLYKRTPFWGDGIILVTKSIADK
jgi:2-polyprenyl-3-methyl-5-hydroxy-6-metoxy-1,4-benzoquinol methylase